MKREGGCSWEFVVSCTRGALALPSVRPTLFGVLIARLGLGSG
jgi:hypothetical protein